MRKFPSLGRLSKGECLLPYQTSLRCSNFSLNNERFASVTFSQTLSDTAGSQHKTQVPREAEEWNTDFECILEIPQSSEGEQGKWNPWRCAAFRLWSRKWVSLFKTSWRLEISIQWCQLYVLLSHWLNIRIERNKNRSRNCGLLLHGSLSMPWFFHHAC